MATRKTSHSHTAPPAALFMQMLTGKWVCQAISTAVELKIPDQLGGGARTTAQLAAACNASEDGVYRLLRALACVGLFAESTGRKFKLTALGKLLRTDAPESHAGYARLAGHDSTWRPWGELIHSVRTGQPAFDKVFGMPVFEYFAKTPAAAAVFDAAMTSLSTMESHAVASAYDFKNIGTLVDVAGGHGMLLATVLRKHRKMHGILFDLPHVAAGATAMMAKNGVASRCTVESGDFFAALPSGADACMMKHILHDWDDASATKILKSCHAALGPRGKVLVIDAIVPAGNAPHFGKLLDLEMLVLTPHGRERTAKEFTKLLRGAGFRVKRIVPTASPMSVIEAVKI